MSPPPDLAQTVAAVPSGGYRWWYFDGLSDDGKLGFTIIFMIGAVFSPTYKKRPKASPLDHLGVHVALYRDGREAGWAMSEYPASALRVSAHELAIGSSRLVWQDGVVHGTIDERSAPIFWSSMGFHRALRGIFTLRPTSSIECAPVELSSQLGVHAWQPLAPVANMDVSFSDFSFVGRGYHDTNWGAGRLEAAFRRWSWARVGDRILYAVEPRNGAPRGFAVDLGVAQPGIAETDASFGESTPTGWGLRTPDHFTVGAQTVNVTSFLDRTPFYSRYVATSGDERGVGEYLDLDRFVRPGVQFLLHFRRQRR